MATAMKRRRIRQLTDHLKADDRMDRNHLKGKEWDKINAYLAACPTPARHRSGWDAMRGGGANLRKLLSAFFLSFYLLTEYARKIVHSTRQVIYAPLLRPIRAA